MNRLLEYLPDIYHDVIDFFEITETETQEIISIETAVQRLLSDQFVNTASESALRRRERILGIQADPATETLDFRRKRLINRYSTKPPFTVRYLQRQFDNLVGAGLSLVSVDGQNFMLTVTTNIKNASIFKEVEHTIKMIKPANIVYQQQTSLENVVEFKESISKRDITWNYKLGSWKFEEKSFANLGVEEVVK